MIFRKVKKEEIPVIFDLIKKRIEWMDATGIHQWNEHDYLNVYPLSYYEKMADRLYVLMDEDQVAAAAVILEKDDRWPDSPLAYYVHNFVSSFSYPGAGKQLLMKIEEMARANGKEYMRLDCDDDNYKLISFYEDMGYVSCGHCVDGIYHGVRKEKKL